MRPPLAPIGVFSRWERDMMNYSQARTFAETLRLPFVRWPLTIVDEETLGLSKADLDRLREEEPERLWGYFVESAPYMITANINATRKIVNGSPALGDSLKFENHIVPEQLQTAYEVGGFRVVTLENPPRAINLRVGGVVTLDELIESDRTDALVVPLMEGTSDEISLKSIAAAQLGIDVLKVKEHNCRLAFALTDFKLQGRTLLTSID